MSYQLRRATPADSQGIFETQVDAFGIEEGSIRWERARASAFGHPEEHIVMIEEDTGRVVGLVHIGDEWIQVGRCAVLKGDVGHVSIRSELHGQGLGTRMMQWTVQWMRDNGYHLSRLGGLMHFYSRFGYEPFPRRFVEIDLQSVHGGGRQILGSEIYGDPGQWPGAVRPYDEAHDFAARVRLRYDFYYGRSGSPQVAREATPPERPAPSDPDALRWVYERDGEVRGYLFAVESPLEARGDETVFSIAEFAYDQAWPDAPGALMRKLMACAAEREPARVTSRLPFDEMLAEAVQLAGVSFERRELHQAVAGNMILVLNLAATLRQVSPELSDRLANSLVADWEGTVEIAIPSRGACPGDQVTSRRGGEGLPGETCRLLISNGAVSVIECSEPADLSLKMTQTQFVKALFGITALTELEPARMMKLSSRERYLLDTLFPRTQTGSGPWG